MKVFLVLFLFVTFSFGAPGWLPFGSGGGSSGSTSDSPNARPRTVVKIVKDTIYLDRVDTVVKYDTIKPALPVYYNYTIYYEIVDKKIALQKSFLWDFANTSQKTQLQSSDTTLLSLGKESLRENSYTYDNLGNKTQTFEKIIEGLDMRITGANANITYRIDKNLLTLNGKFDNFGLLQLSSDFNRRRYFLYFIPLDFLGIFEKYTLFLRVEKSEVKL